jgi:hypothetical protein
MKGFRFWLILHPSSFLTAGLILHPSSFILEASMLWRFRGSPHYLDAQAARLGLSKVLADRARHNAEILRVQVLVSQLCERFHRARKEDGVPVFGSPELAQVKGTLEQAELELQKLHMLAAASAAMLDDAWSAFRLAAPNRPFAVLCDYDAPTLPLGDGTVGIPEPISQPNGIIHCAQR